MDLGSKVEATSLFRRIGFAVTEGRREHELSKRQLAALSGVSRATIRELERGGSVRPDLLMRLATVIAIADVYTPPWRPAPLEFDEITAPVDRVLALQDGHDAFVRTWAP
jgi:transcriptional regulator with XRE-family HTH domain